MNLREIWIIISGILGDLNKLMLTLSLLETFAWSRMLSATILGKLGPLSVDLSIKIVNLFVKFKQVNVNFILVRNVCMEQNALCDDSQ